MKAKEVLRLYKVGERDFRGENLQGQFFKSQDLSNADFRGTDIRGANFSKATLNCANFGRAKAGLQQHWKITLVIASWLFAGVSGTFSVFVGSLVSLIFHPRTSGNVVLIFGWISLAILVTFFSITLYRGIGPGLSTLGITSAVGIVVAVAVKLIVGTPGTVGVAVGVILGIAGTVGIAVAITVAGTIIGTIGVAVAVTFAIAGAIATVSIDGASFAKAVSVGDSAGDIVGTSTVAIVSILFSTYISWYALAGDPRYRMIQSIATAYAATNGTSFYKAKLSNADFNQTYLKGTDFRKAKLVRTCWHQAQKLDHVRPGDTYLRNAQVRALLQSGQAQEKGFDFQNLRGINLRGANLADTSFRGSDLSKANLQYADLSRANLGQAQLDQTDLTRACLTGACIEDWGITNDTQLQDVRCDYIYMRWVRSEDPDQNPHRKPDNWAENFADGDFDDFIKPIVDTLDLYHNQEVDPRAIAISLKHLAEHNPDAELRIAAIEAKGDNKILLRVKTSAVGNHSELSRNYFETYNQVKALSKSEVQLLLESKDERIHSLENFVETALKCPSFFAETYYQQGDNVNEKQSVNIHAGRDVKNISGVAGGNINGVINLGELQGDVNNKIQQIPDEPNHNQSDLKKLLSQLQTAITEEPTLSETEKAAALEQIKSLAEAGQAPQLGKMQQLAKRATAILKGMISGLSEGTKLVTSWDKLGPVIMALFSLG